jgi:hypothetical protein
MNPPFHIRKSENALLINDVWDYEFIRRAYAMLNVGGELIAITSKKWQMEKQAQKFYEKVDAEIEERKGEKFGNVRIDVSIIKIIKMTDAYDNEILGEHFYKAQEMNIGLQIIDNNITLKEGEKIEKNIEDIYKEFGIEEDVSTILNPIRKGGVRNSPKTYGKKPTWDLHAVVLQKAAYDLPHAKKTAADIIKDDNKTFFREEKNTWRFRNEPKQKFSKFRSKQVNPNVSLVFGELKGGQLLLNLKKHAYIHC